MKVKTDRFSDYLLQSLIDRMESALQMRCRWSRTTKILSVNIVVTARLFIGVIFYEESE